MVNIRVVSRYSESPPLSEQGNRPIPGGPLYERAEVLALLAAGGAGMIRPWTSQCLRDMQSLRLDQQDLHDLVSDAVRNGRFIGAEWCVPHREGPCAACDAYQVTWLETVGRAGQEMRMDYYVKFAIGCTGAVLLMVSCHISR
jgi:hypothetical protein